MQSRRQIAASIGLVAALLVAGLASGCERSVATSPDVATLGRDLYASACSRCHGDQGKGGVPLFDGGPSPRNFSDHSFQASRTDEQIKLAIVNGKGTGMPPFGTTFTDPQLAALVAHVRSLDPEKAR